MKWKSRCAGSEGGSVTFVWGKNLFVVLLSDICNINLDLKKIEETCRNDRWQKIPGHLKYPQKRTNQLLKFIKRKLIILVKIYTEHCR